MCLFGTETQKARGAAGTWNPNIAAAVQEEYLMALHRNQSKEWQYPVTFGNIQVKGYIPYAKTMPMSLITLFG